MRNWFVSLALASGVSIVLGTAVSAQRIEIQVQAQPAIQVQPAQIQAQPARVAVMPAIAFPGRSQMTHADAIFVGRVMAIEPMDVEAVQVPGTAKVNYRIAVVQVTETIHGLKKGTKEVRIGFVVQANNVPGGPLNGPGGGIQILPAPQPGIQPLPPGGGFGPRRPFPGFQQIQLTVGQDGLFVVNSHPKEKFYLSPNFQNFVASDNKAAFEPQLKTAKQLGRVMGDPIAALKAEDKQDRYTAAAILIGKYRTASNAEGKPMKQVPIDAAESKLILQALAGGEWKIGVFNPALPGPAELFNQLGVQQKDGYNPMNIRNQQDLFTAMQKWLDENNGKYVIQKFEVDPTAKAPMPGVLPGPGVQPGGIRPGVRPLPPIQIQPAPQDLPPQPAPKQEK